MNRFADPACPLCKGEGSTYAEKDEVGTYVICACTHRNMLIDRLKVMNPELLVCGKSDNDDVTVFKEKDMLLVGNYYTVLSRVRLYFIQKLLATQLQFSCLFLTDLQMKDIWLGKKHVLIDVEGKKEKVEVTLHSMLESPDLAVFVIGHASYQNRALPGIILEALKSRRTYNKPVWVYIAHDIGVNDFAYSQDMAHYLASFEKVTFKGGTTQKDPAPNAQYDLVTVDASRSNLFSSVSMDPVKMNDPRVK
jgi:hypothetical protein